MRPPDAVLAAYGFDRQTIEPIAEGLINETYCVYATGERKRAVAALQRIHHVFDATVNLDIDAVTKHLASKSVVTPRIVPTQEGATHIVVENEVWRTLSWIPGQCFSKLPSLAGAESAGELVGRFHNALVDLNHSFHFTRSGAHDTEAHLTRLRQVANSHGDTLASDAALVREHIFAEALALPELPKTPPRICHGDLKISNVLFDTPTTAVCLIDLDTVGKQTIAFELGDALRSWGNPAGEDVTTAAIQPNVVQAVARGYARGSAGLLSSEEVHSVIPGLETICLQLAARFCWDVFADNYFGWDKSRYSTRREHNLVRAKGQLSLALSVRKHREKLVALWTEAF